LIAYASYITQFKVLLGRTLLVCPHFPTDVDLRNIAERLPVLNVALIVTHINSNLRGSHCDPRDIKTFSDKNLWRTSNNNYMQKNFRVLTPLVYGVCYPFLSLKCPSARTMVPGKTKKKSPDSTIDESFDTSGSMTEYIGFGLALRDAVALKGRGVTK